MSYQIVYLLIEGSDDERFVKRIVKPLLERKYNSVMLWKYAEEPEKRVNKFLKSIKAMNSDYFYLRDINRDPCITAKKERIQNEYEQIDNNRIIIVIKEIESWYLAGLDDESSKKVRISPHKITDNITKEQFNSLIPKKFDSRIDFMSEILKYFSVEIAKRKNGSFRYFMEKI